MTTNQQLQAPKNAAETISTRKALISILGVFLGSLFLLILVYSSFPNVTEEEKVHLKVPFSIEDAKNLGLVLNRYKVDHYYQVMLGVFLIYIFLQTFAIPGSLFLSILSGFLFPFHEALILICICSALGASLCFLLSQLVGRKLVMKLCPKKAKEWAVQVDQHKDNLLNYIIFLRMTPILPNWFINLTAPLLGVPLVPFALGTFIGVAPPSFFAIQGGRTLQDLTSTHNPLSLNSVGLLFLFGIVSLIPVFLRKRMKDKEN